MVARQSKAKPVKKKRGKHSRSYSRKKNSWKKRFWRYVVPFGLLVVVLYIVFLDFSIRFQFEGKKWALPARVYARPLDMYPGKTILPSELDQELGLLNYRQVRYPKEAGSYSREGNNYIVITRSFVFWDGKEAPRKIRIHFDGDRVASITGVQSGDAVPLVRFDPGLVGSIYPSHNEDRVLVRLEDVPEQLVEGLLAVEDRKFYQHHGIDIYAIGRAFLENIRAGR
ncbi:MAG: transglycosylase domain-containing protein, partial [Gammaproteobacteria bacterium]|nr:transglycosylase domain-containing protein [Gammaproteobacteria bacterium]